MKVKKGKLNFDQSGRAYPDNPRVKENWDCIWEFEGKYYELVGDNEHKEWDEVNIYNQIIDEAYKNYEEEVRNLGAWAIDDAKDYDEIYDEESGDTWEIITPLSQEEFINKCKTDTEFSEKWGLKIEERELSDKERVAIFMENKRTNKFEDNNCDIPTKLITLTYNNETIESYE